MLTRILDMAEPAAVVDVAVAVVEEELKSFLRKNTTTCRKCVRKWIGQGRAHTTSTDSRSGPRSRKGQERA